jgi:soluble lytic murein transglycosylase-like protein
MHKLTFLAAALAAGMMTFAVNAEAAGSKKSEQAAAPCPYLFGCRKAEPKKVTRAAQASTTKAGKAKVAKSGRAKVHKRKIHRKSTRVAVDNFTTASIVPAVRPAVSETASPANKGAYSAIIARYAGAYGVPVSLAQAVIHVESNYRPNLTGSAGEVGLMQIKPSTARMLGYTGSVKGLYDPETNIKYGMKYLAMAQDLGNGTTCGTILKYNAGHAATRMNPVSSAYCQKVKVQLAALGSPA